MFPSMTANKQEVSENQLLAALRFVTAGTFPCQQQPLPTYQTELEDPDRRRILRRSVSFGR